MAGNNATGTGARRSCGPRVEQLWLFHSHSLFLSHSLLLSPSLSLAPPKRLIGAER